jgi:hypothetical protein
MGKKIALNVFYNLIIFVCALVLYIGITEGHFIYIVAAVFGGSIFVILKIKLMKEIRNTLKP